MDVIQDIDAPCKKILLVHLGNHITHELHDRQIISSCDALYRVVDSWLNGKPLPIEIHLSIQSIATRFLTDIVDVLPYIGKILPDILPYEVLVESYRKLNSVAKKYEPMLHTDLQFFAMDRTRCVDLEEEQHIRLLSLYRTRIN